MKILVPVKRVPDPTQNPTSVVTITRKFSRGLVSSQ